LGASRIGTDPTGAIDAWRRALELEPRNYDLLFNLIVTMRDRGRAAEARPYAERFMREAPPDRYARDIAAFRAWLAQ
jgi:tetratricopeptide (TPR) repeat protein